MENYFNREELILGKEALNILKNKKVAIFGIGGVGGYALEALVRSGLGNIVLIDNDEVSETNINRQIIATTSTIGEAKVDVAEKRIKDINPEINVKKYKCFYLPENRSEIDFSDFDYVIDAVDTVSAKIDIISRCNELNIPVISAMGAGNKIDPTKLVVTDLFKTDTDPLAKVMRHELRKRKINKLKVVYSKEEPKEIDESLILKEEKEKKRVPGSTAFVPSVMGIILAFEVVKDLLSL